MTINFASHFSSFDTELRVWEPMQPMPYVVRNYAAIVLNGKIHVAGGLITDGAYSNRFCCYDPNTDTWAQKTQIDFEVRRVVLFEWKQCIYAVCTDAILRKYDLETDTWSVVGN